MADNVDITAGTGTTIATDDCTTGQVQLVKLAYGADGNRTHIPGDADGLKTNPSGASLTALQLIDDPVFADDAAFTVGTSKVNMAGAVAVAHGSSPTAVAAGDAIAMITNRHRVPFVIGGHPNIVTSSLLVSDADNAQTNLQIGPGTVNTGTKVVVTQVTVLASNANSANVACKIGFGATAVPADSITPAAGILAHHPAIPPGGGMVRGSGDGILGVGGDGEEVRLTCGDPVGGSLAVTISYFLIES